MKKKIFLFILIIITILLGVLIFFMKNRSNLEINISGISVNKNQYINVMNKQKYYVSQYFAEKYDAKITNDFWKEDFNGEIPYKFLADKTIEELVEITKNNTGMIVNFCLNYSSKLELFEAFKKMSKLDFSTLEVNDINKYLFQELPPIDFLIRTSGEKRLSDFMLYQAAYAELYFPEVLFPDFNYQEFDKSLEEYAKRDRRFGGVKYEKKSN